MVVSLGLGHCAMNGLSWVSCYSKLIQGDSRQGIYVIETLKKNASGYYPAPSDFHVTVDSWPHGNFHGLYIQ